jgi:hypothetical protein
MTEIRTRVEKIVKDALVTQSGSAAIVSAPARPGVLHPGGQAGRLPRCGRHRPQRRVCRREPRSRLRPDVPAGPGAAGVRSQPP